MVARAAQIDLPVVILEDKESAGNDLVEELESKNVPAYLCKNLPELMKIASGLDRVLFVIDIHMGRDRRDEGIEAIRQLKNMARRRKRFFYVAALTSHTDREQKANEAGADTFIPKTTIKTDALELIMYRSLHIIEIEKKAIYEHQIELAKQIYADLGRQLRAVKNNPRDRKRLAMARGIIRRALGRPFILPNEPIVLSTLDEQLRVAEAAGKLDNKTLTLCLQGVALLADDPAGDEKAVAEWARRARRQSPEFIFPWLEEEDLDDEQDA